MSNAKSIYNQENTYICEVCGKEFIPLKLTYSKRFCSKSCHAKYAHKFSLTKEAYEKTLATLKIKKEQKEKEILKSRKSYNCENCGKLVTPENYFGTGRFCCRSCANKIGSKLANTEEKRKEKSNTIKNTFEDKGIYNNKTEKELYYLKCEFKFNSNLYQYIIGNNLLKTYKWFNSSYNPNGVVKDHRISRIYGWENKINPNLISHPANCEIMLQITNAFKSGNCSITVKELKEAIKEWDMKYGVYSQTIYDEHLLD